MTVALTDDEGAIQALRIDGSYAMAGRKVLDDWAYCRNRIDVSMTPPGGATTRRAGYALTVFQKASAARWQLARDADLLTERK